MSFEIAALNLVDFAAIIILVISGILATLRGLTREIMGLVGWPISIIAAKLAAPLLDPLLIDMVKVDGISQALAWGIPFIIVVILWFALSSVVSPGLSKAGLGGFDRWLGFIFGLVRGFLVVLIIYAGAVVAADGDDNLPSIVGKAQITPMLRGTAQTLSGVLPSDMAKRLIENLPDADAVTDDIKDAGDAAIETGSDAGEGALDLLNDEG